MIIKIGNNGPLDNTPVYEVPPGHYFAMGDNRDNSQDSRVLSAVGYIPAENLVGKAQFIFFSTDGSARWWEIWKWPFAVRYGRLFHGDRLTGSGGRPAMTTRHDDRRPAMTRPADRPRVRAAGVAGRGADPSERVAGEGSQGPAAGAARRGAPQLRAARIPRRPGARAGRRRICCGAGSTPSRKGS